MLKKMNILFWLRRNQTNKKGFCPLWCTISMHSLKAEFSCKLSVKPDEWNQDTQEVTSIGELSHLINENLALIKVKLMEIKIQYMALGRDYTPADVKNTFFGKKPLNRTFLKMFDENRERRKLKPNTIRNYRTRRNNLEEYLNSIGNPNISPQSFDLEKLDGFVTFLQKKKISRNHIAKHISTLKQVFKLCITHKMQIDNSLLHFEYKQQKQKRIICLTISELETLENYQFASNYLERVKDLFIFQCYTGFAYTDMANFDIEAKTQNIKGNLWIVGDREKQTGTALLPLFPTAKNILEKYNYQLPVISIQKYNSYLKEVALITGIKKHITTHTARRTAGYMFLNSGCSFETVSRMLGHKSVKTTQSYYAFVDTDRIHRETKNLFK